nr:MAG TPA: Cellular tumor antigen p53-inducible 5 [Caudoviricetes sp.]
MWKIIVILYGLKKCWNSLLDIMTRIKVSSIL